MYYAKLSSLKEIPMFGGGTLYSVSTSCPMTIECPDYCQTEEEAVQYLTNAGYRRFKLYERNDTLLGEYEPQDQPVVRKVVPTNPEASADGNTKGN